MSESPEAHRPHVVVHPVDVEGDDRPFRRVDILDQSVGHAYNPADIVEFMRRADLDPERFDDPRVIEWRGGGPGEWEWHTPT
jgi:hypothetical protein